MKLKIKEGEHLVSSFHYDDSDIELIINLTDRWIYKDFKQKRNHLIIETKNGIIDFVFAGETSKLIFDYEEKEQLIFKIIK